MTDLSLLLSAVSAVLSILVNICALMSSHLSAFQITGNIRKALMAHIAELSMGFIGERHSGRDGDSGGTDGVKWSFAQMVKLQTES